MKQYFNFDKVKELNKSYVRFVFITPTIEQQEKDAYNSLKKFLENNCDPETRMAYMDALNLLTNERYVEEQKNG